MFTSTILERNMIDIHMHLIPGVDDGAESMEMALLMLLKAGDQGIRSVFCTPHSEAFRYSADGARIIFRRLQDAAAKTFPDRKLYLGCEVFCEPDRMAEIIENLNTGRYPAMNGTNYVLMEFSQWVMPERTAPCVEALANAGFIPIIAHLERYRYLRGDMELVNRFRDLGALVQINAYSLFEEMDDSIKDWARRLVRERKADFLGTDAHRTYHRSPKAQAGLGWLYENIDSEYADAIAWKNAQLLLLDA